MKSPTPPLTRLERILSALWVAAVTSLAIPALIAAFSRDTSRPIQFAPPDDRPTVEALESESLDQSGNANILRDASNR